MIDQNMSLKEDNTNYCSQQKVDAKKNHIPMVKQQMLVLTGRIGSYRRLSCGLSYERSNTFTETPKLIYLACFTSFQQP